MTQAMGEDVTGYVHGFTATERTRLARQAALLEPFTRISRCPGSIPPSKSVAASGHNCSFCGGAFQGDLDRRRPRRQPARGGVRHFLRTSHQAKSSSSRPTALPCLPRAAPSPQLASGCSSRHGRICCSPKRGGVVDPVVSSTRRKSSLPPSILYRGAPLSRLTGPRWASTSDR